MRNPELDRLKAAQQNLFERKQAAFQKYVIVRDQASIAHDTMQQAWEERTDARDEMNREFEARQAAFAHHDRIWEDYRRVRDANNSRIDSLKYDADTEHEAMKDCFDRASDAYQFGDKSEAPYWSSEGHTHKEHRDRLNAEISVLVQEIRDAKAYAETHAPKVNSDDFTRAKARFERTKAHHERLQNEFKSLKTERDRLKTEFDHLQEEFKQAKAAFEHELENTKRIKAAERESAISKVNTALMRSNAHYLGTIFGQDAKIVPRRDGSKKIDVYFAGLGSAGDGLGHGHAVIDSAGNVTYLRDAWTANHKDYLIDDSKQDHTKF